MSLREKPSLEELYHYGVKRRSGRYPWGSGEDPYQHSGDFISRVEELKKQGKSEKEIAEYFKMSTTDFRLEYKNANTDRRLIELDRIKSLKEKGYSNYKIAEMMGLPNESSVRSKLTSNSATKLTQVKETSEFLKQQVAEKKFIDVGKDVERSLNISRGQLDEAIYDLKMQGYEVHERYVNQLTNQGKQTTYKVLCPPGTDFNEFRNSLAEIKSIEDYTSQDGGQTFHPRNVYPKSMDSNRLMIRYADDVGPDGVRGVEKDGIVEIRRGVEDLSLGESRYAQVRILVDNDRYIKGMAVYSDDMPDGVDVIFNTNKSKDVPMRDVLKKIKNDPDNPFGSSLKSIEQGGQYYYKDKDGNEQLGLINKRSDEGDWKEWSNNLPSQFLSKQPLSLAKQQLKLAMDRQQEEYDAICSLTNPTVKKKLLDDFAEGCDSAAVHLKAAALPGQQYHVIVPINSLKDTEVFAPNYKDGEQVALIRYPHGGTFEIPICTVNNKHANARKLLGTDVIDAVGINHKVAERLSGADFDGDTVMVIPVNEKSNIKSTKPLKDLEGFDPKLEYGCTEGADGKWYNKHGDPIKVMNNTQNEMGRISNLITDMTLLGATNEEKARAVKHSMVVIDAEKHHLDYKSSERDNNIKSLKDKYQRTFDEETGKVTGGASTIISRSKSQQSVLKRQGIPKVNKIGEDYYDPTKPEGALLYKTSDKLYYPERLKDGANGSKLIAYRLADGKKTPYFDPTDKKAMDYYRPVEKKDPNTGETYFTNKDGDLTYKRMTRTQKSTKMAETDDANTLVSNAKTAMELAYATYANNMKALANKARKESMYTGEIEYNPTAKEIYANEVSSLNNKLDLALKNSPKERTAQLIGNSRVEAKMQDNPGMTKEQIKKLKQQELERARVAVGAKRVKIEITDSEWEAIQSGAITKTKLKDILNFADMDVVRAKAMPKTVKTLSAAQTKTLKAKMATGRYTVKQLADFYNVSTSTISNILYGKEK